MSAFATMPPSDKTADAWSPTIYNGEHTHKSKVYTARGCSSRPPVLRPAVDGLYHLGEERGDRVIDQLLEEARGLLVGEVEPELLGDLEHVGLSLDVRYVGVGHEEEQVEDEVGGGAQDVERLVRVRVRLRVRVRVRVGVRVRVRVRVRG